MKTNRILAFFLLDNFFHITVPVFCTNFLPIAGKDMGGIYQAQVKNVMRSSLLEKAIMLGFVGAKESQATKRHNN